MEIKECPFATHLLYFKCLKCELIDMVYCKDAKDWKCPRCPHDSGEYQPNVGSMNAEITTWRRHFLNTMFEGDFKHVSIEAKNMLTSYFLSIPSEAFTTPYAELHKCLGAIIQHLDERRK